MSVSPNEPTVLIVDPLPLRNLGLVVVLDRLSAARKFRLASLTPEGAEKWIDADTNCSMIIYNVGGSSIADHKHQKRIKELRAHAGGVPLVIFSDNDSRAEIFSAFSAGAQGFLYAGTDSHLALQALSFIFNGGSYFPAAVQARVQPRRHRPARLQGTTDDGSTPTEDALDGDGGAAEDTTAAAAANLNLTERQKSVLEHLGRGDSNKAIARRLGIREGTVKVHVRQIMRKLGVANRTQVAIVCANGAAAETRANDRCSQNKTDLVPDHKRLGVLLADSKA